MSIERDVLDRFEAEGFAWFVTGSWALAAYAEPRMTRDIDVVIDAKPAAYETRIRPAFETAFLVNDPVDLGGRWMGGLIHKRELVRVDLMFGRTDPWARSAMERRRRLDYPGLGTIWLIAVEDLVLAKLEWSDGTSELQLRDVRSIVRLVEDLDWPYIERYAAVLGISERLEASVPVDQAQTRFDARLLAAGASERIRLHDRMRWQAVASVWAQADRAGPMTALELARFLLRRLYPDLEGPRLDAIMARLAAEWATGAWTGFHRPDAPHGDAPGVSEARAR